MKTRKNTPVSAALINIAFSLLLFVAAVLLLAYIMTKNDLLPNVYKTAYIAMCGVIAFILSFLNGKRVKVKPLIMCVVSFAVSTLFSVMPVIAVSGVRIGISVLFLPAVCLVASFGGTTISRKI